MDGEALGGPDVPTAPRLQPWPGTQCRHGVPVRVVRAGDASARLLVAPLGTTAGRGAGILSAYPSYQEAGLPVERQRAVDPGQFVAGRDGAELVEGARVTAMRGAADCVVRTTRDLALRT
ncbi:hypothetical protein ACFY5C_04315 [Streptomyces sp. NPDC012935]|uniref:hypothetical protein n=1 Tax=Streptomyces sp. NPDC012935 TaxID=3364857 RepID=UPI003678EFD8